MDVGDLLRRPGRDHLSPGLAALGPEVDYPVGLLDHVQVVLDHEHRVARVDEPTTGLHFADIEKLLEVLDRLVEAGNTVVVIEHNLDVIKQADWIVDLGLEGGEAGGEVIATGTPEQVADVHESYTGRFLRELLPSAASAAA